MENKGNSPGSDDATDSYASERDLALDDTVHEPSDTGKLAPAPPDELSTKKHQRYDIGDEIARGGLGRILSAYDRELGRTVAIKELLGGGASAEARFVREATITARLEHPAIVPIHEAGRWPDGEPFYAMKLVSGRDLKDVIGATETFADRLAVLPHILAVADALAYAHSEQVIHRDLKPSNILVGDYGETVVIDWGLAKDLAREHAEVGENSPAATSAHSHSGSNSQTDDLTSVGTIMGTPAYMSPEQARGQQLDPRADVYAIGAVLYYTLTGQAPYHASGSRELVELVRSGPPTPVSELVPNIPADLAAIISRAMSRDLDARYRDAGELATDLRRFQRGQLVGAHQYSGWQLLRRWIVRRRAAVAVAAVMTLVLLAVAVVSIVSITRARDTAEEQRAAADDNRAGAEELLNFMMFDLHNRLRPVGKLELLSMVSSKASDYWRARPIDWSRPKDAMNRGVLHLNMGDVHFARGDLPAARKEYVAGQAILKRLRQEGARRKLSVSHNLLGGVHQSGGNLDAAIREFRAGKAVIEALLKTDPANTQWRNDLAASHNRLGKALRDHKNSKLAFAEYQASKAIFTTLVKEHPANNQWQRNLSVALNNVGDMLRGRGDLKGAFAEYHAAKTIRTTLMKREPKRADRQRDLAQTLSRLGYLRRVQQRPDDALVELRAAKAIQQRLARRDPTNANWQIELAMAQNMVGDALRDKKDFAGAFPEYIAAMAIRRRLVKNNPSNVRFQRDLALNHVMLGKVHRGLAKLEEAAAAFRAGHAIHGRLAAKDPSSSRAQRSLAGSSLNLGAALMTLGKRALALPYLTQSATLYKRVAVSPTDFYNAASANAGAGNSDKAFELLGRAVGLGYDDSVSAAKDANLKSLHTDQRWAPLLQKMAQRRSGSGK